MAYCLNNNSETPPSCSDGLIVVSPAEYLERNPFALDIQSAFQIGVAIMSVWATAYVFRVIGQVITERSHSSSNQE